MKILSTWLWYITSTSYVARFIFQQEYYSRETIKEIVSYEGALKPERIRFFACEIVNKLFYGIPTDIYFPFQLQALTVLHAAGIIHRDLRPENIIVDNAGHVVVGGFESSDILPYSGQTHDLTFSTTPPGTISMFSAPEILLGWSHDYLVDTWGFGMLLLFMSSGKVCSWTVFSLSMRVDASSSIYLATLRFPPSAGRK